MPRLADLIDVLEGWFDPSWARVMGRRRAGLRRSGRAGRPRVARRRRGAGDRGRGAGVGSTTAAHPPPAAADRRCTACPPTDPKGRARAPDDPRRPSALRRPHQRRRRRPGCLRRARRPARPRRSAPARSAAGRGAGQAGRLRSRRRRRPAGRRAGRGRRRGDRRLRQVRLDHRGCGHVPPAATARGRRWHRRRDRDGAPSRASRWWCPARRRGEVVAALRAAHPYEEPAFDLLAQSPLPSRRGTGRLGELPRADDVA